MLKSLFWLAMLWLGVLLSFSADPLGTLLGLLLVAIALSYFFPATP